MGTRTWSRRGVLTAAGKKRAETVNTLTEKRDSLMQTATQLVSGKEMDNPSPETIQRLTELGEQIREQDRQISIALGKSPDVRLWRNGTPGLDNNPNENGMFGKNTYENTPERQAFRARIVADALSQGSQVPKGSNGRPVVIVMLGAPGSGKSTIRTQLYGNEPGYAVVDADGFKELLPEYRLAVANSDRLAAARSHEESSLIAKQTRDAAIAGRYNFVMDGTGANLTNYLKMMDTLRDAGYEIRLLMPNSSVESGLQRNSIRSNLIGRYVPPLFLRKLYREIPKNFFPLAAKADEATLIQSGSGDLLASGKRGTDGKMNLKVTPKGRSFARKYKS